MSSALSNTGRSLGNSVPGIELPHRRDNATHSPPIDISAERLLLTTAGPGDHPLVQRLLALSGQSATAGEFHLQLEEPGYLPNERVVIRLGSDIVGHVRLSQRELHIAAQTVPVAMVRDLVVLPEYRKLGLVPALLKAAVEQAVRGKVPAMLWQTSAGDLAASQGFVPIANATCSSARPRDVLSALAAGGLIQHDLPEVEPLHWPLGGGLQPLTLRWWRHYELPGLMRLYDRQLTSSCGSFVRSDDRWRWLISRHGYDRIYVAIDGPDSWELDNTHPRLVGYAVLREARIVELVAAPERPDVAPQLLARACSDAIEQDCYRLHYDAPPSDPLHQVFAQAAHSPQPVAGAAESWQIKLFDMSRWLALWAPEFWKRWRANGELPRTGECGLLIDGHKWLLTIGQRSAKLVPGKLGRSYLTLDTPALSRLMLGTASSSQLIASGVIGSSTALAATYAETLFPTRNWWLPPWEELPACA